MARRIYLTLFLGLACLLVVAVVAMVYRAYEYSHEVALDCYAADWTAEMIVMHMRASGESPKSWSDLEDDFIAMDTHAGSVLTLEEIESRVAVDFDRIVDVAGDVVRLRSGRRVHWEGKEPNSIIRDAVPPGAQPPDRKENGKN